MSAKGSIESVIFDMDGVLTDSEPLINAAVVAMFKEQGLDVHPEDFLPFLGMDEDHYIDGVAGKHHFHLDLPAAKRRTYEIYLELAPKSLKPFPGAVELVKRCKTAGLKVALASSSDRIKIEANLRHIALPPAEWDAVVYGEEVERQKPSPDIFLMAAQKLRLAPAKCAVIEDGLNGVQAAKLAGMRCIAVAQTFGADQLKEADVVRARIADVSEDDLRG